MKSTDFFSCLPLLCMEHKAENLRLFIRPNKKNKCVSGNGSENLGRIGTHIFDYLFYSARNKLKADFLCHFNFI